ncbi:MAG: acyl-[ACP]--phospholipid O-acyltransferase [Planctomycetaceae bacterium]|nr:acyl-[ACP]--phospholipid O-acyltransferase [Planctomycetaceae bacterium]
MSAAHPTESRLPHNAAGAPPLLSTSFVGYLLMSFLTAVNDSMYRWLIIPLAKQQLAAQNLSPERLQQAESLIMSAGLLSLVLPFVVFAPYSSWIADRFSKRTTTLWLKIVEVILVGLGIASIVSGNLIVMFSVLFLYGTQSALLSTAKYGIIPELVPREKLSAANGLVALVTLVAAIVGAAGGLQLAEFALASGSMRLPLLVLGAVAVVGVLGAVMMKRVQSANPTLEFPWNPVRYSWQDMKLVMGDRPILRVTLGIAFFWSLASLAQMNIDSFVTHELQLAQTDVGLYLAVLSVGVGLGSVLAGWWSGGRVELGMVALGALLMSAAAIVLFLVPHSVPTAAIMLSVIGMGGGLFNVPLNAYLQERSPHEKLGAVLAAGNQITSLGIVLVAGLFWLLSGQLHLSAATIFLVTGLGVLPVLIYTLWLLPQATVRFGVWLLSRLVYRVRIHGGHNIPEKGAGLLVANHVTWIDGILLLLSSSRNIRMVAFADYVQHPLLARLSRLFGIIPITPGAGPRQLMASLNVARDALHNGELVCIFAEGQITRNGQLMKFERGLLKILKGTDAPVIPVYLDELWGSVFSHEGGRFLWKKPRHWPYPVSISFGPAVHGVKQVDTVRHAVLDLAAESMQRRKDRRLQPASQLIRESRLSWSRRKVADSSGRKLTGGELLTASLVLRSRLQDSVLVKDVPNVGLLLPPTAAGVIANAAVTLGQKVAVNLNYTLTQDDVNFCIAEAGVQQVLTSRAFMEKRPMELHAELIYIEDLLADISAVEKGRAWVMARFMPQRWLEKRLGLHRVLPDDTMSIIFTSGSTGRPKGVMLSCDNIVSNIEAVRQLLQLKTSDTLVGVLPFFHSFGYTVSMWLPLCASPAGAYHVNPLDSRTVGKMVEEHRATILMATPTFLRSYMKRCTVEQFQTLNLVIVGAEKLPDELRDAFREKYGIEPSEGYGTTELSPIAAVNIPPARLGLEDCQQPSSRHGSVGRVIPGSAAAVFDLDTGERLPSGQEGMLKIKGPNVMKGYLNLPEQTAELMDDGWYRTGDLAVIDEDGFIRITGRLSRFSKIGGEMVPHLRIEAEITRLMTSGADTGDVPCAVTAVPDARKGERLIVLHRPMSVAVSEVMQHLQTAGLPNLWIPAADSYVEVAEIPMLGTGKLDLKGVQQTALTHVATAQQKGE